MQGTKKDREVAIRQLAGDTTLQRKVTAMVIAKGGKKEEATMVYSDTVVAFLKQVFAKKEINITGSLTSYILGIARHKWYDLLKVQNQKITMVDIENAEIPRLEANQYKLILKSEKKSILNKVLASMATRCKEVIMYWAGGYKMIEIAKLIGYKSEGMARKKKSECMKELLAFLADNPHIKEQLR